MLAREASEDGFNRMKMNRPLSSKSKPGAVLSNMDVSGACLGFHLSSGNVAFNYASQARVVVNVIHPTSNNFHGLHLLDGPLNFIGASVLSVYIRMFLYVQIFFMYPFWRTSV